MTGNDHAGALVDRYVAALAFFGEQVAVVPDAAWEDPTPCGEWNVRSVIAHVVVGESQIAAALRGETVADLGEIDSGVLGSNPMAAWRGTALAAIEVARGMAELNQELIGRRITENLVHGWDVAVASSREVTLPDDGAEWVLDFWLPRLDELVAPNGWGPMLEPSEAATPGERVLALMGRVPSWTAGHSETS
jgi:uncharacterized protein (TIGR03086 family)